MPLFSPTAPNVAQTARETVPAVARALGSLLEPEAVEYVAAATLGPDGQLAAEREDVLELQLPRHDFGFQF